MKQPPNPGAAASAPNLRLSLENVHRERSSLPPVFFDNLSFIGNEWVGCFVLETDDGLIQIDCMEDGPLYDQILREGYQQLGLDFKDLKAILITHGHGDHYGNAKQLREQTGCKLYMSRIDEELANQQDPSMPYPALDAKADGCLEDLSVFRLGNTEVFSVFTPGHTPGCLSLILPVYDEGRKHMAALFGGSGLPKSQEELLQYAKSCRHFDQVCKDHHVDVEISTHPFLDHTKERLAVCRNIVEGAANPFVIGEEAAARCQDQFLKNCLEKLEPAKS